MHGSVIFELTTPAARVAGCSGDLDGVLGGAPAALLGRPWTDPAVFGAFDDAVRRRLASDLEERVDEAFEAELTGPGDARTTVRIDVCIGRGVAGDIAVVTVHGVDGDHEWDAEHDALTGLPNRRVLDRELDRALRRAARAGTAVAVLFVDLDDFKGVNDSHGHAAGDEVLTAVAGRLTGAVRGQDLVVRAGGDEFIVVASDLTAPGEADGTIIAGHLEQALEAPIAVSGGHLARVTASVGLSVFPRDAQDAWVLLASADAAMYRAKRERQAETLDPARAALVERARAAQRQTALLRTGAAPRAVPTVIRLAPEPSRFRRRP